MRKYITIAAVAVVALVASGCMEKIPGEPEKVMRDYVEAVQKDDFKTIYKLHMLTARQQQFLSKSEVGDVEAMLREHYENSKKDYDAVKPTFAQGITWSEKHFFPASATFAIGDPYHPPAAPDDPVNAEYEKAQNVIVPVNVTYSKKEDAPELEGAKVKSAGYMCFMKKIRQAETVRVYSHDEKWYFGDCLVDEQTVTRF